MRNDAPCSRCGWIAPGPISDALDDARAAAEAVAAALARAEQLGWTVHVQRGEGDALAA